LFLALACYDSELFLFLTERIQLVQMVDQLVAGQHRKLGYGRSKGRSFERSMIITAFDSVATEIDMNLLQQ
jgi:predicted GNAT superfamily acetyltransferase